MKGGMEGGTIEERRGEWMTGRRKGRECRKGGGREEGQKEGMKGGMKE